MVVRPHEPPQSSHHTSIDYVTAAPESQSEPVPAPPEKRWPSLREYAHEPSLMLKVVVGCAVTAVFAFLFLPMIVGVYVFSPRPAKKSIGGSAGT